jgi:hypothetical protein
MRWMGIEGDDDSSAVMLGRVLLGGSNHLLVAEVEAIKHTHGECQGAGNGGEGVDGAENLHAVEA